MGFCDKPHGANKPMKLYRIKNTEKKSDGIFNSIFNANNNYSNYAIGVFSPHEILTLSDVKEFA